MEDVVLHYQPGAAAGLSSLLERAGKLLDSFPHRTPPVFAPWFPAAADRHLPIRPAKAAPVIACSGVLVSDSEPPPHTEQSEPQSSAADERPRDRRPAETSRTPPSPQKHKETSETSHHRVPELTGLSPVKHEDDRSATRSPVKRSWSVFAQRRVSLQSFQPPSKQFQRAMSVHKLDLRQRAKWVIGQHNCGAARDIEQVWRTLSRSVRSSGLPTCNANIQRERAEIWVFCDVLHAEQVGGHLKEELQLSGRIGLSVRRLGNIFSM